MESLIAMAVALILAAQQPQVPVELRIQALKTAEVAISYAQNNATVVEANPFVLETNTPEVKANDAFCTDEGSYCSI